MCEEYEYEAYAQSVIFWLKKALKEFEALVKKANVNQFDNADYTNLYNTAIKINIAQNSLGKFEESFDRSKVKNPSVWNAPKYCTEDDLIRG
jgi:hypothetical protein